MSDPKDFVAGIDSDQRRSPTRVVFVTRRTFPRRSRSTAKTRYKPSPRYCSAPSGHRTPRHRIGPLFAVL